MARYDVVDEAGLPGTPEEVWAAFEDELTGRSNWWHPFGRMQLRDPAAGLVEGAVIDVAASAKGDVDAGRGVVRIARRVTSIEPPNAWVEEYVEGVFRGTMETRLERASDGETRIRTHWKADLHGPLRFVLRFLNLEKTHHELMRAQFEALRTHLGQRAAH